MRRIGASVKPEEAVSLFNGAAGEHFEILFEHGDKPLLRYHLTAPDARFRLNQTLEHLYLHTAPPRRNSLDKT